MCRQPELLSASHGLDRFESGVESLDYFLKYVAMNSHREGHSRTFVISNTDFDVVGFCALCGGMLDRRKAPRQIGGHGAPSEIPVALLARLVVDRRHQGRQIGTILLRHAFASVLAASQHIGFRAIMVHALDEQATEFYSKFGFRSAKGLERTLLISLQDVARIMENSATTD